MSTNNDDKRLLYRIPEIHEPTLFDYIVKQIPKIFRFTEYLTITGFILYLALKTESKLLYAFSTVLYGCVLFYVMDKQITFVKKLEFRNVWIMRITSLFLLVLGVVLVFGSLQLVLSIATAQK
ncbi:hypothetical protein GCM10008066_13160 [Oxalicibacterium faecigallinarum]|uniref:Uncharacterized protein n=1 Tax=Oxalicibacterium faecigallinarum TaxID=573741 RepID=A0A8J3ARC9_9BURK|nr:hypothetical protein GCM10008066_13160 [Oxalicibacterium faecigallinarum]